MSNNKNLLKSWAAKYASIIRWSGAEFSLSGSGGQDDVRLDAGHGPETVYAPVELVVRCVVYAEVRGLPELEARLGHDEARHAVDRCLKRMRRAVEGFGGEASGKGAQALIAAIVAPEGALQAACEMLHRVRDLPPVSGVKLELSVGIHRGELVREADEFYGESVNAAAGLAGSAVPGQVLASADLVSTLRPDLLRAVNESGSINLHGQDASLRVYAVDVDEAARLAALAPAAEPERGVSQLMLGFGEQCVAIDSLRTSRTLGRDLACDLVVDDVRASRTHARIERRGEGFVLVDLSRNGTFVSVAGGLEVLVRREEIELRDSGRICLGRSSANGASVIQYEIVV